MKKRQFTLYLVAAIASFIVMLGTLVSQFFIKGMYNPITPTPTDLSVQLASLKFQVTQIQQELDALSKTLSSNPDIVTIQTKLTTIDSRLTILENAVLDNPQKALELTLMQRDIDDLKTSSQSNIDQLHKDIDRVYSQNNWFIGLIFTMALAVISLTIGSLQKGRGNSES